MSALHFVIFSSAVFLAHTEELFGSQFPLYGITELAANNTSEEIPCYNSLRVIYLAIRNRETWALYMLDSSGIRTNGYLLGNNYWLGGYSQCRSITSAKHVNSSYLSPFSVGYYICLFKQNFSASENFLGADKGKIHLGLCLPEICTGEELEPLLKQWSQHNSLTVQKAYNFTLEFESVRLIKLSTSWIYSPLPILLISVFVSVFLLTIYGTLYDVYICTPIKKEREIEKTRRINNKKVAEALKTRNIRECSELLSRDNNLNEYCEMKIDNSQHKAMPVHIIKTLSSQNIEQPKESLLAGLSVCFSVTSNARTIFKKHSYNKELSIVRGLQFFGMNWLLWLNLMENFKKYADNKYLSKPDGFSVPGFNLNFAFDTLFFTSGYLLVYKYYKNSFSNINESFSIKKKINEFSFMILERFLRLTPFYLIVIGLLVMSSSINRQISLFEEKSEEEICEKYWWRNIAYVNNLYSRGEMCMSWSWYLSLDMQFFFFGTFVLVLSTGFWKVAAFVSIIVVLLTLTITAYLSFGIFHDPGHLRAQFTYILNYYPWFRIGPHSVGMLTGIFILHWKNETQVKKIIIVTCWLAGIVCAVWALYGTYVNTSLVPALLHSAVARTAWSFGLSCIMIMSHIGYLDNVCSLLSHSVWSSFSKLLHSFYLLHPLIINLVASRAEVATHFDPLSTVIYYLGNIVVVYISSFLFSWTLEIPLRNLASKLIRRKEMPNQLSQAS